MAIIAEVVCGATGQDLVIPILDENDTPLNITNASSVKLQGKSADIVKTLDVAGTVIDGFNGKAKWEGIGNETTYISQTSDLVDRTSATFTFRVKITISSEVYYSDEFQITWVRKPI